MAIEQLGAISTTASAPGWENRVVIRKHAHCEIEGERGGGDCVLKHACQETLAQQELEL